MSTYLFPKASLSFPSLLTRVFFSTPGSHHKVSLPHPCLPLHLLMARCPPSHLRPPRSPLVLPLPLPLPTHRTHLHHHQDGDRECLFPDSQVDPHHHIHHSCPGDLLSLSLDNMLNISSHIRRCRHHPHLYPHPHHRRRRRRITSTRHSSKSFRRKMVLSGQMPRRHLRRKELFSLGIDIRHHR